MTHKLTGMIIFKGQNIEGTVYGVIPTSYSNNINNRKLTDKQATERDIITKSRLVIFRYKDHFYTNNQTPIFINKPVTVDITSNGLDFYMYEPFYNVKKWYDHIYYILCIVMYPCTITHI